MDVETVRSMEIEQEAWRCERSNCQPGQLHLICVLKPPRHLPRVSVVVTLFDSADK